jgi:hypothetical protein
MYKLHQLPPELRRIRRSCPRHRVLLLVQVLRCPRNRVNSNTSLPAAEVAQQYKRLLVVERFFRAAKSLLETRPVYHKYDATIAGHLFVSFLALVLRHELEQRLAKRGWKLEWGEIVRDLEAVEVVEVQHEGRRYLPRPPLSGVAGKVLQAVGVAIPPPVKDADAPDARTARRTR